jgi:two-component system, OmpR family, sensor kinase
MGALGTAMLRSYLYGRVDEQLLGFASAPVPRPVPAGIARVRPQQLPTQFLVEVISASGRVQVAGGSGNGVSPPRIPAARLRGPARPFTAAAEAPGHSWRVLVRPASGGGHVVIAYSLDALSSTVTRLEAVDAAAGAVAILVLAVIGLPLIRVGLAPLSRIEDAAEAIAAGDLSRRIDRPAADTEVGRLAAVLNMMLGRSRRPTGPGKRARRTPGIPKTGCAALWPTPATNCGRR